MILTLLFFKVMFYACLLYKIYLFLIRSISLRHLFFTFYIHISRSIPFFLQSSFLQLYYIPSTRPFLLHFTAWRMYNGIYRKNWDGCIEIEVRLFLYLFYSLYLLHNSSYLFYYTFFNHFPLFLFLFISLSINWLTNVRNIILKISRWTFRLIKVLHIKIYNPD